MHISRETSDQIMNRLLKVIATAEFTVLEGTYAFEEFPLSELSQHIRLDALALVRDNETWSQLVPSQDASKGLCTFIQKRLHNSCAFIHST